MALSGRDEWEANALFTDDQVRYLLEWAGVEVDYEDHHGFRCYCIFHNNTDSPAMSVNGETGGFKCFNPGCDESGNIYYLLRRATNAGEFEVRRKVMAARKSGVPLSYRLEKILNKPKGLREFTEVNLDRLHDQFWESDWAQTYMQEIRGFTPDTINRFQIGYSAKRNMIVVPVHDDKGMKVGFVGRTADTEDKKFHNSKQLPRYDVVFNMHRAKRTGSDTLILCEATFDAALIDQAGFPNVAAFLGSTLTEPQAEVIRRHFRKVIIMTDNDKPRIEPECNICPKKGFNVCMGHNAGREVGRKIEKALAGMTIRWAAYDEGMIFPEGKKDAGDLDEAEIVKCIDNSVSTFVYNTWKVG